MSFGQSAAIVAAFAAFQPLSDAESAKCRRETQESVSAASGTTKPRDMLLLRGLSDRCAGCGKCPDMIG